MHCTVVDERANSVITYLLIDYDNCIRPSKVALSCCQKIVTAYSYKSSNIPPFRSVAMHIQLPGRPVFMRVRMRVRSLGPPRGRACAGAALGSLRRAALAAVQAYAA